MAQPILIVEDNTDLRMLYQEALEMEGHSTEVAANGFEALELLKKIKTLPKLILLDLMMPVMDGWEFLSRLRDLPEHSKIPVVICSAAKDKLPPGTGVVRKPVDLDVLFETIRQYSPAESQGFV